MNSLNERLFSHSRVWLAAMLFVLLSAFAGWGQAQGLGAVVSAVGSVEQPLGDEYAQAPKANSQLSRITVYRPLKSAGSGVTRLELDGQYHTSLQVGGFTQVCVAPSTVQWLARVVQGGVSNPSLQVASLKLSPQAQTEWFVRVLVQANGSPAFSVVAPEVAAAELAGVRRQVHAVSRVTQARDCLEPAAVVPAVAAVSEQPKLIEKESITLGAAALFPYGKSSLNYLSDEGRAALDLMVARLQNTYRNEDNVRIHVTGHTDPIGDSQVNQRLSEQRALAVREYLLEEGLKNRRITAEGVGSQQLLVTACGSAPTASSIACNKPNRRVVVSVQVQAR